MKLSWKSAVSAVLVLCLISAVLGTLPVSAETVYTEGNWKYTVSGGKATVYNSGKKAYTGTAATVTVPATLGGYPVTGLGAYAFAECNTLTGVTVPGSVTAIGYNAFSYCKKLTKITLKKGLRTIGDSAFCGSGLTEITIPESVTALGEAAFDGCRSLQSVTLKPGLKRLSDSVFYNCSALRRIDIPDTVTEMGYYVFYNCAKLTEAVLGSRVPSLGEEAFCDCTALRRVVLPADMTGIGDDAFDGCTNLRYVFYTGKQWKRLSGGYGNECLAGATVCGSSHLLKNATVKVAKAVYTGEKRTPAVTVTAGGKTLRRGEDYTLTYHSNVKIGKAQVTVTGKNGYFGAVTKSFTITPKAPTVTLTAGSKKVTATWAKVAGATGYGVQMGTNKAFTKGLRKAAVTARSKRFTDLKKGTTYYVRVRAYKKVGTTKIYSAWSTVKKIKVN